jgi:hypothetical protein
MSPTFLNEKGYKFFTHSNEEERKHVHVNKRECECKFWLEPTIELAENFGFKEYELNEIKKIIEKHGNNFKEKWDKYFR